VERVCLFSKKAAEKKKQSGIPSPWGGDETEEMEP